MTIESIELQSGFFLLVVGFVWTIFIHQVEVLRVQLKCTIAPSENKRLMFDKKNTKYETLQNFPYSITQRMNALVFVIDVDHGHAILRLLCVFVYINYGNF